MRFFSKLANPVVETVINTSLAIASTAVTSVTYKAFTAGVMHAQDNYKNYQETHSKTHASKTNSTTEPDDFYLNQSNFC